MKKKSIIAILLTLVMCFSLVGCGEKPLKDLDMVSSNYCEFIVDGWGHGESIATEIDLQQYGYDDLGKSHFMYLKLDYSNLLFDPLNSFSLEAQNPLNISGTFTVNGNSYDMDFIYVPKQIEPNSFGEVYLCYAVPVEEWTLDGEKMLTVSLDGEVYSYVFENAPVKPEKGMTKEEALNTQWGSTGDITTKNTDGVTIETLNFGGTTVAVNDGIVTYVNY